MDTPLPDGKGVLVDTYGSEQFSRDAIEAFTDLREELVRDAGLLHAQMSVLAEAVRRAIVSGDMHLPIRVCAFLDAVLDKPKVVSEIRNAIAISFVEFDELQETKAGRDLLERMPHRIRAILLEQAERDRADR